VKSELLLNTQAASATQRADIENHLSTVKRSLDDKVKELQKVTEDASAAKSSLEGLKVRSKADLCFSFAVFVKKCSTVWTTSPVSWILDLLSVESSAITPQNYYFPINLNDQNNLRSNLADCVVSVILVFVQLLFPHLFLRFADPDKPIAPGT